MQSSKRSLFKKEVFYCVYKLFKSHCFLMPGGHTKEVGMWKVNEMGWMFEVSRLQIENILGAICYLQSVNSL